MKSFLKKNKFFISLLSLAVVTILSLSVYIVQERMKSFAPSDEPIVNNPNDDAKKTAEISSLSVSYNTSSIGNSLSVLWNVSKNSSTIDCVYLYLNDNEPLDVTSFSSYNFPQSVYNFPTGDNAVKLEVVLDNGKKIIKEASAYVDYVMSVKQDVALIGTSLHVTLEYVYTEANPVTPPTILTNDEFEIEPVFSYVDTQTKVSNGKVTARTTYSFSWANEIDVPSKMSVRWKFNNLPTPYSKDFTVIKPEKQEEVTKE